MPKIALQPEVKVALVRRLQRYCKDELQLELGGFDAEFLLDFFSEQMGGYFYNQGLADALVSFESKLEEIADSIYQLEQDNPVK